MFKKIINITFITFLLGMTMPNIVLSQGQETQALNYQRLIKKNFNLRKQLKETEKKYIDLENERKFLILHVKELQTEKDSRARVIGDLKNMIASLRIEMLKDPKLTKTIDRLNRRITELLNQTKLSQEEANQLKLEKEKLVSEMQSQKMLLEKDKMDLAKKVKTVEALFDESNKSNALKQKELENKRIQAQARIQQLTKELNESQSGINEEKGELKATLEEVNVKKANLVRENDTLQNEIKKKEAQLNSAQIALTKEKESIKERVKSSNRKIENEKLKLEKSLALLEVKLNEKKDSEKKSKTELKKAQILLNKAEKDLEGRVGVVVKAKALIEKQLEKANNQNKNFNKKVEELQMQALKNDKANKQLLKDLKKEQLTSELSKKNLKKELLKNKYDNEHFEEQLKYAKADQAMLEAKIKTLEQRDNQAEAKYNEIKDQLIQQEDKALLKESEVLVLREEKLKLEEKLVRYIEKIMDNPNLAQQLSGQRWDNRFQRTDQGNAMKSKGEIAEQKLNMHYNLALAYNERRMFKEAEREYRKCLKINSKDANVHYNLAILYDDHLNKNKKAIAHYTKYLKLRPGGEGSTQVKEWIVFAEQEIRLGAQAH